MYRHNKQPFYKKTESHTKNLFLKMGQMQLYSNGENTFMLIIGKHFFKLKNFDKIPYKPIITSSKKTYITI